MTAKWSAPTLRPWRIAAVKTMERIFLKSLTVLHRSGGCHCHDTTSVWALNVLNTLCRYTKISRWLFCSILSFSQLISSFYHPIIFIRPHLPVKCLFYHRKRPSPYRRQDRHRNVFHSYVWTHKFLPPSLWHDDRPLSGCSRRERQEFLLTALSLSLLIISVVLDNSTACTMGLRPSTRNIERRASTWVMEYLSENPVYDDQLFRHRFGIPMYVLK